MTKFEFAVIAASIVVGAILIERAHRTVIDAPSPAEIVAMTRVAACPDNDNVPYSARCLTYISGWFWRANAAEGVSPVLPSR